MVRPTRVVPLPGFRLQLRFSDGAEGVLDVSDMVGRGVFAPLLDESFFASVYLGQYGQIAWNEELELCPDAAYAEITGNGAPEDRQCLK